jgi:hypothetical protein
MNDTTLPVSDHPAICPKCGQFLRAGLERCPHCGTDLVDGEPGTTVVIPAAPPTPSLQTERNTDFHPRANVILQMEPSGVCISVAANKPTVLGRGGVADNTETAIDLSEFGAYQYGVSRRHCQLRRRGMQLLLTDLGSANGTYLNDQALVPHRDQVVAHGDHVTLSRLRLTVLFSVLE